MPLYEYRCKQCGHQFEIIQSFSAPEVKVCQVCGGEVERLISAPAIQFKGSGWYVNDYAGKSKSGGSKAGGSSSESGDGGKGGDSSSGSGDKPAAASSDSGGSSAPASPASSSTSTKSE